MARNIHTVFKSNYITLLGDFSHNLKGHHPSEIGNRLNNKQDKQILHTSTCRIIKYTLCVK